MITEGTLLAALRKRYTVSGNGGSGRWAFLTHVRTGASFEQQEIDAVAMALWPSDGLDVHAFEVKCSRSDWLREIKPDTYKSRRTRELADTFTIVAPKGVVQGWEHTAEGRTGKRPAELPEGWGLIEATGGEDGLKLRSMVKPSRLQDPERPWAKTLSRGFVVAMLRASGSVPGMVTGRKREAVVASATSLDTGNTQHAR